MGHDDLHKKRRERKARDLERKQHALQQQQRILIVCEDSKSGAYYFEDMASDLELSAVNVRGKECGSSPISVVEYAEQTYEMELPSDSYDRVYCVFDRDQHDSFDSAIQRISNLRASGKPFFPITSTPCFEFWLLLHFKFVAHPYMPTGKRSPCDQTCSDLKTENEWQGYDKGSRKIYAKLAGKKTEIAIKNAKRLLKENEKTGSNNPETNVHELVEFLSSLSLHKPM